MIEHTRMSQTGQERVKADYLVVRTLAAMGGNVHFDDLKHALNAVIDSLTVDAPIQFTPTSGPVGLQSRSFNEAIYRCRDSQFIDLDDQTLMLTARGDTFISTGKYIKTDAATTFTNHVDEVVTYALHCRKMA